MGAEGEKKEVGRETERERGWGLREKSERKIKRERGDGG